MAVIYRITNAANGKYYIGSTDCFDRRKAQHVYALRSNKHKNPILQAAWNKYGESAFVFDIIEEVPESEDQLVFEDRWLRAHVGQKDCYNVNTLATAPRLGVKLSEESKTLISINRKGKAAGADHFRYGKTVSEAVRQKISDTQRGKPKAPGRKVSQAGMAKIRAAAAAGSYSHWEGKSHTEKAKEKMMRPLVGVSPDGVQHHYKGFTPAAEELGVPYTMLVRCCKEGKKLAKGKLEGWFFAYADEFKEVPQDPVIPDEYKHLPRTRQQAKAEGAKEYFTGVPCSHGHISPRLTKGTCIACRKEGLA